VENGLVQSLPTIFTPDLHRLEMQSRLLCRLIAVSVLDHLFQKRVRAAAQKVERDGAHGLIKEQKDLCR
jgi:hypothetical protein